MNNCEVCMKIRQRWFLFLAVLASLFLSAGSACAAFSLVMTNGYGDCYRMNLLRSRENYEAYRGICSYRGFSLTGCSTTGEVVMIRIKGTPSMPEYSSLVSTSLRWGTTMYFLNDLFHPLCSWVSAGYENWYPFDMSCSVAMYINSGGFGAAGIAKSLVKEFAPVRRSEDPPMDEQREMMDLLNEPVEPQAAPKAFSLVMTNGYGDCYRMNLIRSRENYQAYRGICSYRGFSLSGCSTTGEVVMIRILATPSMPEHFSLLSTSMRWGTTMYVLNDVFRPLNSWVMAGYENWYPFDMSCSVAMYINSGGFGAAGMEKCVVPDWPAVPQSRNPNSKKSAGALRIGALMPLTGDLADSGVAYVPALGMALSEITNAPGMPPIELLVENTDTDPLVANMKLESFYTNGVQIVVGPESSAECEVLRPYADAHGMVLLSCASTAVPLAITNDNLMRLTMDDSYQARELARQIAADGITHLALLKRSDMYGDGMRDAFVQEYTQRGGTVFFDEYYPRITNLFGDVISQLNAAVAAQMAVTGMDDTGVLIVSFDEGRILLQEAAAFPTLASVRWYGTDGLANNATLLTDPVAREVARQTRLTCSLPAAYTNAKFAEVSDWIQNHSTHPSITFAVESYDALWLAALALRDTGGTGTVAQVREAIRTNAATYAGASGPIVFNGADDRAEGQYEFLKVTDSNTWADVFSTVPDAPVARAATDRTVDGFTARWAGVAGATNYLLDVATNTNFGAEDCVPGYFGASVGNVLRQGMTGLIPGKVYSYRVRAANAAGTSSFSASMDVDLYRLLDSDGDGSPDWEEIIAGTDSGDSNSIFRVVGVPAPGQVTVQSVAGRIYQMQYTTNLLQPIWWPVPGATNIPGDNGILVLSNAPSGDVQRTYRIAVEAAP